MVEVVCHLHVHSGYSDGALYHDEIAAAAAQAGVDVLFVTDHNVYVRGVDGWRETAGRRVLLLAGEEIHQQDRDPQKNHVLVLGAYTELAKNASDPQMLLDAVRAAGGVSYLAHPFDSAAPLVDEPDLSWVAEDAHGYSGMEIWNYMSEFKSTLRNPLALAGSVLFPSMAIHSPPPQTLRRWDSLLARGIRSSAIGGSDAHGSTFTFGPLKKVIFPYRDLFRTIHTHLLLAQAMTGDTKEDARSVIDCLRSGRCWVGYDFSFPSKGFRFSADGDGCQAEMGNQIAMSDNLILRAQLPTRAHLRLIRAGHGVVWEGVAASMAKPVRESGAYRLEAWRWFRGRRRGWIFSNPIYVG
jgi:hypothetical protein